MPFTNDKNSFKKKAVSRAIKIVWFSPHFLQKLINLKNYDDRLYVNVDDLAV